MSKNLSEDLRLRVGVYEERRLVHNIIYSYLPNLTIFTFLLYFCFQEMYGFKRHQTRSIACFIAGIFSTGLLFLIFRWKPNWAMKAMYTRCSLEEADAILLRVGLSYL